MARALSLSLAWSLKDRDARRLRSAAVWCQHINVDAASLVSSVNGVDVSPRTFQYTSGGGGCAQPVNSWSWSWSPGSAPPPPPPPPVHQRTPQRIPKVVAPPTHADRVVAPVVAPAVTVVVAVVVAPVVAPVAVSIKESAASLVDVCAAEESKESAAASVDVCAAEESWGFFVEFADMETCHHQYAKWPQIPAHPRYGEPDLWDSDDEDDDYDPATQAQYADW